MGESEKDRESEHIRDVQERFENRMEALRKPFLKCLEGFCEEHDIGMEMLTAMMANCISASVFDLVTINEALDEWPDDMEDDEDESF